MMRAKLTKFSTWVAYIFLVDEPDFLCSQASLIKKDSFVMLTKIKKKLQN